MIILAQIVGIAAVIAYLLSYQFEKRRNIVLVNATANVLYVLQYIMLGAFEGAVLDTLSAVSAFVANARDSRFVSRYIKIKVAVLNIAMVISGLVLYKNIFSLFPLAGAILQTNALWMSDEKKIRLVSFLGAPFWLVYNTVSQAYGSALGSLLSLISIGIAILRYDIFKSMEVKE